MKLFLYEILILFIFINYYELNIFYLKKNCLFLNILVMILYKEI